MSAGGLSGRFPERLARQVPATGPPKLFRAGIIVWCPYHRMLPLPQISRPPEKQAKPAADITDWTALTPDDFFAAPTAACRAESVPAAAVPETERRLAGGVLQARELHPGRLLRLSAGIHTWRRLRPSTPMTRILSVGPAQRRRSARSIRSNLSGGIEFARGSRQQGAPLRHEVKEFDGG